MGWVDVEPDPYEPGGNFFKFDAVGKKLYGWWIAKAPSTGQYGGTDYTVQVKENEQVVDKTITAKGQLLKQLEKAERNGMKIGMLVNWACTGMQDIGKQYPMPVVKVQFDPTRVRGQQQRQAQPPQTRAAPAPQQPRPPQTQQRPAPAPTQSHDDFNDPEADAPF